MSSEGGLKRGSSKANKLVQQVKFIAELNSNLCIKLHRELRHETPSRNVAFSPFGVSTVMGMVKLGAAGNTALELESVCGFATKLDGLKGYSQLIESLKEAREPGLLGMASELFVTKKPALVLKRQYVEQLQKYFLSEPHHVDFSKSASPAGVAEINHWVEKASGGTVFNAVDTDLINEEANVILVSALYFNSGWKYPFCGDQTQLELFYLNDTATIEVDMLYGCSESFRYAILPTLDAEAVAFPCKDDRIWFLIYVPRQRRGLSKIEDSWEISMPSLVVSQVSSFDLTVYLPRFKIECCHSFSKHLQQLGLISVFSDSADLSGMTKNTSNVSLVQQKVIIDVSEVVTASENSKTPFPRFSCVRPAVIADRPFFFQMYDTTTGIVLLSGSVVQPEVSKWARSSYIDLAS